MKKIFLIILIIITNISILNAYELNTKDKIYVNKLTYKIEQILKDKSYIYQKQFLLKLKKIINNKNPDNKNVLIITQVKNNIEANILKKQNEILVANKIENNDYKIDMKIIRSYWLELFNSTRKSIWLHEYSYDEKLNNTANEWSEISKNIWNISHKRDLWDSYYDYNKINAWFNNRWVKCENIYRVTFSENIWWWKYKCNDNDCNQELKDAIKWVFNMYLWEKNKQYRAHYESIVNSYFNKIWVWISIKNNWNNNYTFYITTHYCTKLK